MYLCVSTFVYLCVSTCVCVCVCAPVHQCESSLHVFSRLEELFLCLNEFDSVNESSTPCPSLRLLQITDNQLRDWQQVRKFGPMYPGLDTLVLANNSLTSVQEPPDNLERLFPNLRSINLNNSGTTTPTQSHTGTRTWRSSE